MKVIFSLFLALALFASWVTIASTLEERLAPVGEVCMSGDACASAAIAASTGPRDGASIYTSHCATCHGAGIAGAPKLGDVSAWQPRVDQGRESLYTNAIQGLNGMPAMGTCGDCSEDDIKLAVDHMVGALN